MTNFRWFPRRLRSKNWCFFKSVSSLHLKPIKASSFLKIPQNLFSIPGNKSCFREEHSVKLSQRPLF